MPNSRGQAPPVGWKSLLVGCPKKRDFTLPQEDMDKMESIHPGLPTLFSQLL